MPISGSATWTPRATRIALGDHRQADDAVGAGVEAVGDEGRALQSAAGAEAYPRRGLVAEKPITPAPASAQRC